MKWSPYMDPGPPEDPYGWENEEEEEEMTVDGMTEDYVEWIRRRAKQEGVGDPQIRVSTIDDNVRIIEFNLGGGGVALRLRSDTRAGGTFFSGSIETETLSIDTVDAMVGAYLNHGG